MKDKHVIKNIVLSAVLLFIYVGTYFAAPLLHIFIAPLDFITAAGCIVGICLLLFWMPCIYYYSIALFACMAQYFGMMFRFYERFSYFDLLLHFISGFLLTMYGYYLYQRLTKRRSRPPAPTAVPVLFSIFFAVTGAAVWEFYEFFADCYIGTTAQGIGVADTMEDMIAGTASAVLCGVVLAFVLERKR